MGRVEKVGGLLIVGSDPADRTAEIHAEICPGPARKSEAKSHGHITWDTRRMLNGSRFLDKSVRRVSGPISALI